MKIGVQPGCVSGDHCEKCHVDSYTCPNGVCKLREQSPVCICNPGYVEQCNGGADVNKTSCQSTCVYRCADYCLNKGTCRLDDSDRPSCACAAGFSGKKCQVEVCKGKCDEGKPCVLGTQFTLWMA